MKYGIDCGHNCAYDGGAVGIKSENSLIMEVGPKVMAGLKALGHMVVDCSPKKKVTSLGNSLRQRTDSANESSCDVFVSIHFNCFNKEAHGTELLYLSESGKNIAAPILKEICKLGFTNRGLKYRDNLHVLKATKMPAVLVECCFCDSSKDMKIFDAQEMANAIIKGLTGKLPKEDNQCH